MVKPVVKSIVFLPNDANGIAEDQTTAAAGSLTLDGAYVSSGVAILPQTTGFNDVAMMVTIEGSGDNSGVSFTVTGTDADGKTIAEILAGGNAVAVATTKFFKTVTAISVNGAVTGNVEVGWLRANGAVTSAAPLNWRKSKVGINVKLDALQQVIITSTGDDSAVLFYISGIDNTGNSVFEIISGSNATTSRSSAFFAKVTAIDTVGNADTLTAGTDSDADGIAQSQDPGASANLTLNGALVTAGVAVLTAAMTYTVDHTMDNVQISDQSPVWVPTDELTALSTGDDGNLNFSARGMRLRLSAYTSGRCVMSVIEEAFN